MESRRLTAADAEAFRLVRLHGLKESPEAFSADYELSATLPVEHFAARLKNEVDAFVIGVFIGAQLVGIGGFYREDGPKLRHKGTIWGVYVMPGHRSGGVGRKLIGEIIANARGLPDIRQINITVTAANERARQLYRSMGFEPWGLERRALWIDGRFYDDEHMAMFLSES
jgi:RimJ/RimL family protein N-acetyltransferase